MDYIPFAIFLTVTIFLHCILSKSRRANFPPGPFALPVVGHLAFLGAKPHKKVLEWKLRYGPIVGLQFGIYNTIVISDYNIAKQALANPAFSGRPKLPFFSERSGGGTPTGVIFSTGSLWHEQRNFAIRRLRDIGGFGTKSMESSIAHQVEQLVESLRKDAGRPINTMCRFNVAVVNTLWAIVAGSPFDQSDANVQKLTNMFADSLGATNILSVIPIFVPWVYDYFPDWLTRKSQLQNLYRPFLEFVQPFIDEHYKTRAAKHPRDFIDAYIDEIEAATDPASSFFNANSKHGLMTSVMDLFQAGSDSTTKTLAWTFLLLASYPDVQDRVAGEILDVVGKTRAISLDDRKSLAFTEAVLHEVMRYKPLFPLSAFRAATDDVRFHGYTIPKDTVVYTNTYEAHFSKARWGDPKSFRPDRWLSEDGSRFVRREGFMAFSSGKRVCLGEQLARDQLFLFTAGILQTFRVVIDPTAPAPTLEPALGGTAHGPRNHCLVLVLRHR